MEDCINNLTIAQQIFAVFYAIFFGLMLQTIGAQRVNTNRDSKKKKPEATLNLFDTPNAWIIGYKSWNKPFWRFLLSVGFLNILLAIIFAIIFIGLGSLKGQIDVIKIVVIVWISLIPHYIYRIYLGLLLLFKEDIYLNIADSKTYSKADLDARKILETDRESRGDGQKSPLNHFAIPLLFVFPLMIVLYNLVLLPGQINLAIINLSYFLILIGLVGFGSPRKEKN